MGRGGAGTHAWCSGPHASAHGCARVQAHQGTRACVLACAHAQECHRYNGLLAVMDRSLHETVKAVKGLVVMSPELEAVVRSMYDNMVRAATEEGRRPSFSTTRARTLTHTHTCTCTHFPMCALTRMHSPRGPPSSPLSAHAHTNTHT